MENLRLDASLMDVVLSKKKCMDPLDDVYGFETFAQDGLRVGKKPSILADLEKEEREMLASGQTDMLNVDDELFHANGAIDEEDDGTFEVPDPERYAVEDVKDAFRPPSENEDGRHFFVTMNDMPEDLATDGLKKEYDATQTRRLMVRDQSRAYVDRLKAFEKGDFMNGPEPFTLLVGERGTGKTVTMNQIVQWCRSNGWLVLFANNARKWSQLQLSVEPSEFRMNELTFDQPEFAEELLRHFLEAHREQLDTIPLQTSSSESSATTMTELILEGVRKDEKRDDIEDTIDPDGVLRRVVDELNVMTDHKVLIAIDEFNYLYEDVPYKYNLSEVVLDDDEPKELRETVKRYMEDKGIDDEILDRNNYIFGTTPLEPQQMTLINQFRYLEPGHAGLQRSPPVNGFVLGGLTSYYPHLQFDATRFRRECDTKGLELRLPKQYSRDELQHILDYYAATDWLTEEPNSDLVSYFSLRWGANPELVRKGAAYPFPKLM